MQTLRAALFLLIGLQVAYQIKTINCSTYSSEQAANSLALYFKLSQESVCDGHVLKIKCQEDYVIDIVTAELTILEAAAAARKEDDEEAGEEIKVSKQLTDSKVVATKQQQTCAPLVVPAENGSRNTTLSSSSGSRATNSTTTSNICDGQQAKKLAPSREETMNLIRNQCYAHSSCTLDLSWPTASSSNGSQQEEQSNTSYIRKLTTIMQETCPANRKLLEVAYRCRPLKIKGRTLCRGSRLELECPAESRIVIMNGDYGNFKGETKNNEKCLADQASLSRQQQSDFSQSIGESTKKVNCTADRALTTKALMSNCMPKRSCSLEVKPELLGDANCPPQQAEYLKLTYLCVPEALLSQRAYQVPLSFSAKGSPITFSANVSSSSLLQAASSLAPPNPNPNQSPALAHQARPMNDFQQEPPFEQQMRDKQPTSRSGLKMDDQYLIQAVSSNAPMNTKQQLQYLYAKHQPSLVIIGLSFGSLLVLMFAIKSCLSFQKQLTNIKSTNLTSANSSSASSSSSSCKDSSAGFLKSRGGSGSSSSTFSVPGALTNMKRNSCSESCFSSNDYNLTTGLNVRDQSNDSPAALELENPHQSAFSTARPKLWSIYSNNEQQCHNHTMRPTRNFAGQSAQSRCPNLAPANNCQAPPGSSLLNPSELLLSMAANQQQPPPPQNWCATISKQQQQSPVDRLFAMNQPGADYNAATAAAAANHCAFHQQQQQLLFTPPTIQLELPHMISNNQAQLTPPQLHPQQQQQQIPANVRHFMSSFNPSFQ